MKSSDYDSRVYELASRFSQAFSPFSQPQHDEQKLRHLTEVLRSAARLRLWLYTQPSAFKFDWGPAWDDSERSTQGLVTVPAVLKTHDENGVKINPPQLIQSLVRKRV